MKKFWIIALIAVIVLGGAFGIYKYFFEELVDYYTIIYIPPYEKSESNYDDLMCGVGLSSYSEPKITVERDWYPNKSDTDDKALSGEERKFKDRKNYDNHNGFSGSYLPALAALYRQQDDGCALFRTLHGSRNGIFLYARKQLGRNGFSLDDHQGKTPAYIAGYCYGCNGLFGNTCRMARV